MLFERTANSRENPFVLKTFEGKKLNWKEKFKRDLFRENLKFVETVKAKKKRDIKEEEEKRAAAKNLSKLFEKGTIYLQDNEQSFLKHGHYSAFIPLVQQVKLKDELQSTFPYIEYVVEKNHKEARINILNEISSCIRTSVDNNNVEVGWRSCLRKYMCDLDTLKAIEIYVELLKKGTNVLQNLHKKYGNQCSPLVFFYRVCQSAKYFKESSKINKNLQSSIQAGQQISEVTLPKTSKFLFCAICLLYDCNQHNMDDITSEFNNQYIARDNIISESTHVVRIAELLKVQRMLTASKDEAIMVEEKKESIQEENSNFQQGEMIKEECFCSQSCFRLLNKSTYAKKSTSRRHIISLVHRSLIHMAVDIFSYDPCMICMWIGKDVTRASKQGLNQQGNRGTTCENIFFYLIEQFDITKRLHNEIHKSEVDYLTNESSRPKNQTRINLVPPNKKRKNKPRFIHDIDSYSIGCCYHYFIGQEPFDHNCEKCCCRKRGFCLPQCQCPPSCQIRKLGCVCKGKDDCRSKKCQCFETGEQCIPGLCEGCFDTQTMKSKRNCCKNNQIQKKQTKYIRIGDSNIAGLGAFAGEDINKDELVIVYSGEFVEHQIDYIREGLRLDDTFYNFGVNDGSGSAVDARFMGNKARFINHASGNDQNLKSCSIFSEGKSKTVLYAKKNIKKGEELFFNYDAEGTIKKNFGGKYDFIKGSKK